MHLFMIYIGGAHEHSLIELHDIRFIVAKSIEDTYDSLRASWWGTPSSLHLDAWGIVRSVDGHLITLQTSPPHPSEPQLYFVNLGGYDPNEFTELHKNLLVVAASPQEAKLKAVRQVQDWTSPHRDYLFDVEAVVSLNKVTEPQGYYIHSTPSDHNLPFEFTCNYTPLGK